MLSSRPSGSAEETRATIATSRGSTLAAVAAAIASAAIRSTSAEPPAVSETKLPLPCRVTIRPSSSSRA